MKNRNIKTILLLVALSVFGKMVSAQCDYSDDFETLPTFSGFDTKMEEDEEGNFTLASSGGWQVVNMASHGDNYETNYGGNPGNDAVRLEGGEMEYLLYGIIRSPLFPNGCTNVKFSYRGWTVATKLKVEIRQNSNEVVWSDEITIAANEEWHDYSQVVNITGNFRLFINNITNSSNTTSPTEAIDIKDICLTSALTSLATPVVRISGAHPREAGGFWDAATVSFSHELGSAAIYYTTDGTVPNPAYDSLRYAAPFEAKAGARVKAVAVRGALTSTVLDTTLAITPTTFSFTVPREASVFVGAKDRTVFVAGHYLKTHYIPFTEKHPAYTDTLSGGARKQVFYAVSGLHNYRVSMANKLTHVGRFTPSATSKTLEVTQEQLDRHSPKEVDHDVNSHNGRNHSDVYLNINAAGHLRMAKDSTFYLMNIRVWQAINTDVDNYFIEPDFHYSIINEAGEESRNVVAIAPDGTLTAVGAGTAIVRVTYDAMMCAHTTNVGNNGNAFFSAIWPENTGVFVVTVSDGPTAPATGVTPNMRIGEYWNSDTTDKVDSTLLDAEHDVLYYPASAEGFDYTFKPEGVASVTLAQPVLDTSTLRYSGFSTKGVTKHADGSYTVRVVHGRNIVRLANAAEQAEYQVISAKPVTWTVSGSTGANNLFQPGDTVRILFGAPTGGDGVGYPLYHPANKLSGIYNMSAGIQYTGAKTNFPLILGPGQYTFASKAQTYWYAIPKDFSGEEVALINGTIKVNGFGSHYGAHRKITKQNGVAPNLNASIRLAYCGSLPSFYFRLTDAPSAPANLSWEPDGETALNLSWEPSRDNGKVAGYAVYRNGEYVNQIDATSYRLEGLTAGTRYRIEVEAVDEGGTPSTAKSQVTARTLDNTAPSVPANLTATDTTETTVALSWLAATDNSGVVAGYIVYVDDDSVAYATGTACTITGLEVVNTYSIAVLAVDSAGNRSAKSQPLSITTPDLTPPTVPAGLRKVSGTATSVTLAWTASKDSVGVTGYLVTLNGDSVNFRTANSVTVTVPNTIYTIRVYAVDAAGNRSQPASFGGNDHEVPSVPTGLTGVPAETSVALSWSPSTDNSGVIAGYVVFLNGDSVAFTPDARDTVTGLTVGTEYALSVAAVDAAGNRSGTSEIFRTTTRDLTPPSVPAGLTGVPAETSVALSWSPSTDNVGVTGYVVFKDGDSVALTPNASYTVTSLTAGTEYALSVAAVDAAGNRSDTSLVTVRTTAPAVTGVPRVGEGSAIAYPNPFGSYLVVEASTAGEVAIYSLQGQALLRAAVSIGSNRISTSSLPQGMYIVRCGALTQLLVKNND